MSSIAERGDHSARAKSAPPTSASTTTAGPAAGRDADTPADAAAQQPAREQQQRNGHDTTHDTGADPRRELLRAAKAAHQKRDAAGECDALGKAHALAPLNDAQRARLIELLLSLRSYETALAEARRWAAEAPADAAASLSLARALLSTGAGDEADRVLDKLVRQPHPPETAIALWANRALGYGRQPTRALRRLRELAALEPQQPTAVIWLARVLAAAHRDAEALAVLRRAVERARGSADLRLELGSHETRTGDIEAARASFAQASELDPGNAKALRLAAHEHRFHAGDALLGRIEAALKRTPDRPTRALVDLHYAAGKAFEDIGDLGRAFDHFTRAGAVQKRLSPWSPEPLERLAQLLQRFGGAEHQRARAEGHASRQPVLIIGMPRAGTTLVEQIVAANRSATTVGETDLAARALHGARIGDTVVATLDPRSHPLDTAARSRGWAERGKTYVADLQTVAPRHAPRIVDKTPGNYTWAGLLDAAVPGCRFIHCRRHPVDTCLSQFRLNFGGEVPYSYDLKDLARAYRVYDRLVRHWTRVLPEGSLIEVRYEDVVADIEQQSKRIMSHIGLDWNAGSTRFHDNAGSVRTASAAQVRRPLYDTSVGGSGKYRDFLRPLLDDIGDLVADYEKQVT